MKRFIAVLGALAAVASGLASGPEPTVADALKAVRVLAIPDERTAGRPDRRRGVPAGPGAPGGDQGPRPRRRGGKGHSQDRRGRRKAGRGAGARRPRDRRRKELDVPRARPGRNGTARRIGPPSALRAVSPSQGRLARPRRGRFREGPGGRAPVHTPRGRRQLPRQSEAHGRGIRSRGLRPRAGPPRLQPRPGQRPGQGHAGRAGAAGRDLLPLLLLQPRPRPVRRNAAQRRGLLARIPRGQPGPPQGERPAGREVRPDARPQHQLAPLGARRRPRKASLPARGPGRPPLPQLPAPLHADPVPPRGPLALRRARAAADEGGARPRLHLPLDERQRLGLRIHGQPLRRAQRRRLPRPRVEVARGRRQGRRGERAPLLPDPARRGRSRPGRTSASSSTSSPSRTRRSSSSTASAKGSTSGWPRRSSTTRCGDGD